MVSLTTRSFDGDIVPEYNPDEASHVIVEPGKSVSKARVTKNIMLVTHNMLFFLLYNTWFTIFGKNRVSQLLFQ
jgi:hypothetical protein